MERANRNRPKRTALPSEVGFTLVELLVTMAIIAIAAAAVIPSMRSAMRDRRVQQSAISVVNLFREARSRAAMRGVAHSVRFTSDSGVGRQFVMEGRRNALPSSSCMLSTFATGTTVQVNRFLEELSNANAEVKAEQTNPTGTFLEVCFSPLGRMFYRTAATDAFRESMTLAGGASLEGGFILRFSSLVETDAVARRVLIPLGGMPRLMQ